MTVSILIIYFNETKAIKNTTKNRSLQFNSYNSGKEKIKFGWIIANSARTFLQTVWLIGDDFLLL